MSALAASALGLLVRIARQRALLPCSTARAAPLLTACLVAGCACAAVATSAALLWCLHWSEESSVDVDSAPAGGTGDAGTTHTVCSTLGSTHLDTRGFPPAIASPSPLRADSGDSGTSSLIDLSPADLCEEAALHDTRSANHVRDSLRPSDPPPPYSYRGLLCHDAHASTSVVRVRVGGDMSALKIVPRRSRDCAREVGAFRRLREQSTTTPFLNYARELWEDESQCYFIMELFPCDLMQLMKSQRLDRARIRSLAAQILVAIDQLHRCGIIHCDIKPANVFIRLHAGDMHAVLGDYGHAHVAPPGADLARVAVTGLRGTPEYTAPEVCAHARGERRAFGAAADVFAFGVLIFAMLTAGKRADFGDGRMPISIQALAASSDPDYELITFHLPLEPRAADVITQCVHAEPEQRATVSCLRSHSYFRPMLHELASV